MNRRGFLYRLGGAVAAAALQLELVKPVTCGLVTQQEFEQYLTRFFAATPTPNIYILMVGGTTGRGFVRRIVWSYNKPS